MLDSRIRLPPRDLGDTAARLIRPHRGKPEERQAADAIRQTLRQMVANEPPEYRAQVYWHVERAIRGEMQTK